MAQAKFYLVVRPRRGTTMFGCVTHFFILTFCEITSKRPKFGLLHLRNIASSAMQDFVAVKKRFGFGKWIKTWISGCPRSNPRILLAWRLHGVRTSSDEVFCGSLAWHEIL